MTKQITGFILAAIFLGSCTSEGTKEVTATTETKKEIPASSKLLETQTIELMGLLDNYYRVKDALVATNAPAANEAANQLVTAVDSFQNTLMRDTTETASLHLYLDTIKSESQKIGSLKDETTEVMRQHFEKVSSAIYGLAQAAELKNGKVYRQYCPMAFDDKGAYWLSSEAKIRNPYFGKKMLTCGEVTDSL